MTPDAQLDRLDSWKEIAKYLGKGVRTVQRWEASEGLPVHRLGQERTGSVFAYKSELDAWWRQQSIRLSTEAPPTGATRKTWLLPALGAGAVGFLAAALLIQRPSDEPPRPRVHPLTADLGWELEPALSPDGRQVAYVAYAGQSTPGFIHVKGVGTDSSVRLTRGDGSERYPAWSPDSRMIAFLRRRPRTSETSVVLIPAGGGAESEIAKLNVGSRLIWSPDGAWLLTMETTNKRVSIVAISVSTGRKHALTEPGEFGIPGFGLTADPRRLVLGRGGPGRSGIVAVALDANLRPIGAPQTLIDKLWLYDMAVTPDGKEFLYIDGLEEESSGLWRRPLTPDGKPELIHSGPGKLSRPTASADGKRVVFAGDHGIRNEVWSLELDRRPSEARRFLASTHSEQNPDFSPDGKQVAFHSTRTGASDIWIADRDGSNVRRVTHTNARTTATPRWSPDGGWIAFESNQTGQTDVYVIRSNGGPARRLTDGGALNAIPNWSRDGRTIYFCSNRTGRFEIWTVPALGGTPKQLTRQGGFTAVESRDGRYLYYTQTRSQGPLYRMALPAGKPELLVPELRGLFFAVAGDGVYYLLKGRIWFWDEKTDQSREVYVTSRPFGFGLSLSPDDRELLFVQYETQQTDLYWIDGR